MTDATERSKYAALAREISATRGALAGIPSDDGLGTMDIMQTGTGVLGIWIHDRSGKKYISPVRIDSGFGSEIYDFVYEELSIGLIRPFATSDGQIPADYPPLRIDRTKRLPSHVSTQVQTGTPNDSFTLRVINIESLDNDPEPEESLASLSFMDIEIAKDGNVTVAIRNVDYKKQTKTASVVFKTGENGGKFPLVAEVFTRVAKKIEAATARRS